MMIEKIKNLGDLKKQGYTPKSIKDEQIGRAHV